MPALNDTLCARILQQNALPQERLTLLLHEVDDAKHTDTLSQHTCDFVELLDKGPSEQIKVVSLDALEEVLLGPAALAQELDDAAPRTAQNQKESTCQKC